MKLDLIGTLALAGVVLFVGYRIQRGIPWLARLNIPAPVIGGLLVAIAVLVAGTYGLPTPQYDMTLQRPLLVAFFTTLGFSASLSLLRAGGLQVVVLLALVTCWAIVQNLVGMGIAVAFGLEPALGVLAGSVTMAGGPATGLAFAPLFEQAGIQGAETIAIATAMAGIVAGALAGGPIGTFLIQRRGLRSAQPNAVPAQHDSTPDVVEPPRDELAYTYVALKTVVVLLAAMWIGAGVSHAIGAMGITLPEYIGAMLVAAAIRNIDDRTGWIGLSPVALNVIGAVALSLFLIMALMSLDLAQLTGLAVPLLVIIVVQVLFLGLFCLWPVFALMGRDYDAAVMTGGFMGFMLGTTANAMAVMHALVERFGAAPRAFLVAPLIGAFFLDFVNALVITAFLNLLQ
nr:sodium/glutamate symporter [uncultured Steroidobacter sp.]